MSGIAPWIADLLAIQGLTGSDKIQIWIAVFAALTAFSTVGLLVLAAFQIRSIRDENRKWETVRACNVFDTDPIVHVATKDIYAASDNGKDYSPATMLSQVHNIITVLNYLDALAIGIDQGVYVESIAKDNLGSTIEKAVECFLDGQHPGIKVSDFRTLKDLRGKWLPKNTHVS